MKPTKLKTVISIAILDYLIRNPQSQDTIDGIIQWWLLTAGLTCEKSVVQEVVDDLVGDSLLVARNLSGAATLYCLNHDSAFELGLINSPAEDTKSNDS
jgi:hypothetical protein